MANGWRGSLWLVMTLAVVPLSGCEYFFGKQPKDDSLRVEPVKLPAAIASVADWDGLGKDVRAEIIGGAHERYGNLKMTDRVATEKFEGEQKEFVTKMVTHMRNNGDMEVVDTTHARVGGMQITARLLLLDAKTIVGGEVWFWHQGCDMPDESVPHFKDAAEAELAGCEVGQGMYWAGHGAYNRDATPFASADFLEWGAPE